MKEYKFVCNIEGIGEGYVIANSKEEARQKILDDDYEDIEYFDESITSVDLDDIEEIENV